MKPPIRFQGGSGKRCATNLVQGKTCEAYGKGLSTDMVKNDLECPFVENTH